MANATKNHRRRPPTGQQRPSEGHFQHPARRGTAATARRVALNYDIDHFRKLVQRLLLEELARVLHASDFVRHGEAGFEAIMTPATKGRLRQIPNTSGRPMTLAFACSWIQLVAGCDAETDCISGHRQIVYLGGPEHVAVTTQEMTA